MSYGRGSTAKKDSMIGVWKFPKGGGLYFVHLLYRSDKSSVVYTVNGSIVYYIKKKVCMVKGWGFKD
jgi:hypothetical protein